MVHFILLLTVFYVGAIFLMPLYHKISEKSDFLVFSLFVVFPQFSSYLIKLTPVHQKAPIITDQIEYFFLLPTVAFGYICSKYNIYDKIHNIMIKYSLFLRILLYILMITIPFLLGSKGDFFDFIYAGLFIFGVVSLIKLLKYKWILVPLSILGKYSLLLWFIHCGFANQLCKFTQPILYYPRNPILVTIWGLAMCLAVAALIQIPINGIKKLKNRLLRL